jgi:hypothetical protein
MQITKPYRVFIIPDYPSWLVKYKGTHPFSVQQLINSIKDKTTIIEERNTEDIEKLINSKTYQFYSHLLKIFDPFDYWTQIGYKIIKDAFKRFKHGFEFL